MDDVCDPLFRTHMACSIVPMLSVQLREMLEPEWILLTSSRSVVIQCFEAVKSRMNNDFLLNCSREGFVGEAEWNVKCVTKKS